MDMISICRDDNLVILLHYSIIFTVFRLPTVNIYWRYTNIDDSIQNKENIFSI